MNLDGDGLIFTGENDTPLALNTKPDYRVAPEVSGTPNYHPKEMWS